MQHVQQNPMGRFGQPALAGMVAQQRQGDIARAAERRRQVAAALAGRGNGRPTRAMRRLRTSTLLARLAGARPAMARALHGRQVTTHTSSTAACCA